MRPILSFVCFAILLPAVGAQTPTIDRIITSNFAPGQQASLTAYGKGLKDVMYLWSPIGTFAYVADEKPDESVAYFDGMVSENVLPGVYETRVVTKHGVSGRKYLVVDDLPTFSPPDNCEVNPPRTVAPAVCCINGQINALKPRYVSLAMKKGQKLTIEVFARRLDSLMDPVLQFSNSDGKEIAFADDTPGLAGDALLAITAPADDTYTLQLRDVQYSGGAGHFFHLRIGGFAPVQGTLPRRTSIGSDVQLVSDLSDAILTKAAIKASLSLPVTANTDYGSSIGTVVATDVAPIMEIDPNDTRETATLIPAEARSIAGRFDKSGDVDWYQIELTNGQHLCVTTHTRIVGSPADVVLQLWDSNGKMLQESDDVGSYDAQLSLKAPASGRFYIAVRELTGQGGPSWTYDADVQCDGRLELSTQVDTIALPQGGAAAIPVTVKRHGIDGSFELRAVNLPPGLTADPVVVTNRQKTASLTIRCGDDAPADFRSPLKIESIAAAEEPPVTVMYRPAPPKNGINHRLPRHESGVFGYTTGSAEFSLQVSPATVIITKGSESTISITAKRTADWTQPIDIASTIAAAELPLGITVDATKIEKDSAAVVVKAADNTVPGRYTISLQGTLKKDKTTIVQPVPTISLDVK